MHDLSARDSLAITATSASASQATLRLSPMAQLILGDADGTSASIANLVARQAKLLQRLVRTACDEKHDIS